MNVTNVTNVTNVIGSQAQKWSCKLTTEFTGYTESSRSSYFPYSILSAMRSERKITLEAAGLHIRAAGPTLEREAFHIPNYSLSCRRKKKTDS